MLDEIASPVWSTPRWLLFGLAILVTLVLWLPDRYILYRAAPPGAVAMLMIMYLAIALMSYSLLVREPTERDVHMISPPPARLLWACWRSRFRLRRQRPMRCCGR